MGDLVFTTFPPSLMEVSPAYWNYSDHVNLDNLKMDSNFIWLLCSLVSTISWVIYIAYYNSRVIGYILTKLLNRFIGKDSYFKIGSFTLCALSGKIMFRDVAYITTDYSVRVQDGYLIFRWWRSYVPKDVSEDLSHSDTRLSVMLNGFELHCYNRCQMYAQLEKTFGLTPQMFSEEVIHTMDDQDTAAKRKNTKAKRQQSTTIDVSRHVDNIRKKEAYVIARTWRDLIPVIKLDICTGRLVFGNCLVPTTLSITVEEAHFVYSTKPAASRHDHFMHFTKCKAENFKVILAPSPKYTGMVDEPPRYMGEGFVVLNSNNMELYYYMDEPGVVPEHPEMIRLVNGDMVEAMPPIWGIDIKCGKGTDFSYGPWADRQREHLFKFFFPNDYQPLKVTKAPVPGDKRQVQSFDVRLSTLNEATIDILFSKNKETNAVHVNIGPGSYLEITMPWIVLQNGYTTKITGQLLHLEATTSLQYRSLVESETLEFVVKCHYPIIWNDEQEWTLNLTGCKATANLVYSHKEFFQDMISDWSNKSRPDILYFVPYTWKFSLLLKEFEIITICNEFNWIDCSSQNQENAHIAFCGEIFDLSFDLPFIEFLSPTIPLRFWIQAESVDLTFYLPEVNTNRNILVALDKNALIQCRDGTSKPLSDLNKNKKWRNICQNGLGWIDCWSVPIVALSINYTYHPCSPSGPTPQANITTPEKEEILLSPMRIPRCRKSPGLQWAKEGANKFDPLTLEPDKLSLELEIGPSILFLNGSLIKNFIHLKENIFGDYQAFTDMQQTRVSSANVKVDKNKDRDIQNNSLETSVEDEDTKTKPFDPREYRPMEVTVGITIHDVQAHLLKNCNDNDPPCPVILLERFGFEMKKGFKETELQLLLSPAILLLSDEVPRSNKEKHLNQGHLMLSALQVRGHAMFSNEGRNLDEETLEYSWLIEVQLGKLSGKMTSPQLHHLITSLETFLLMAKNSENCLRSPGLPNLCHHGLPPLQCADSDIDKHYRCPSSEDIKYRMTRVAIDSVDLYIQESGTASQVWISPVRVSTCNLHGQQVKAGMTGILPTILIRQFVSAVGHFANTSNTNTTASGRSYNNANSRLSGDGSDVWLEVGSVSMGPIVIEAAISLPTPEHNLHLVQNKYLKTHDEKTKRLWFLWTQDSSAKMSRCGCIGGCAFFGNNRNGPRFFKPNHHDLQDGINIAAYRIYEIGKDKGFGQSILHDGQLVFHTPPYSLQDVTLQDINSSIAQGVMHRMQGSKVIIESSKSVLSQNRGSAADESDSAKLNVSSISPFSGNNKKSLGRRFSYTSNRNNVKDVPYSRLVDASPITQLPPKLDSDSKLDSQRSKSILSVPEIENTPKSSASDSKLAVDYFYIQETESLQQCANPQIMCANRLKSNGMTQVMLKNNEIVNVSDSQHSLYVQSDSEDKLIQEVQRTVSMSSENHSEAFYSADEDTSHGMGGSQNSSVRHSLVSTGYVFNQSECIKKKFLSDLSIVESSGNVNYTAEVIPEKAHTLERTKPQSANVCKSPRFHMRSNCQTGSNVGENELLQDSSDSHSVSSTSFISAVSSQEDMTLVNLHMQVNKPIVDSPLLMSSYVSHLTQLRCNNWFTSSLPSTGDAFTTPLFKRTEDGRLVYIGGCYIPKYDVITEGFTSLKMINRNDVSPKASSSNRTPTHPYLWDNSTLIASEEGEDNLPSDEEELLTAQHENGSRTTVIVKLKGDIDVMLTPLVLECLQRFIDAITPTLINLHPLTILNHLHNECIRRVEDANILKQDQSLSYWSQVQASSKRSTAERNIKHDEGKVALQTSVYEESIATQIQGNIILPKINVTLLQASVVEEIISFSALDNIRDLTCVSLFAICLDDVTARFYLGKQAREIVQTFHKPAVLPNQKKVNKITKAFLSGHQTAAVVADIGGGETVYIETSEKQQEEIIVTLNIGKAHTQLRRLRNESSILKDAVITAIPSYYSRVLFTCTRITSPLKCVDYYLIQPSDEKEKQCKQNNPPQATEEFTVGCGVDRLGFIMFECGLEGIKLKIVKRSQFEKGDNGYGEKKSKVEILQKGNINKSQDELNNIAASTMDTLEQDLTTASSLNATGLQNQPHVNSSINAVNTTTVIAKQLSGNTVSCVIELRTVWFNFAAPPRTPITRKIDYTRLDWNLLSTASPAINAWMNPSNRFAIQIVHMFRCMYRRSTAVVACLMAEALDVQAIHMPIKSRYGRLTPLAKTLQEDPSCQLCSILQNYTLLSNLETIEANLCETDLPSLSTLRQGVIVLSRQWKNVLYTPLLLEHNYKTKHIKPVNVAYAVSDPEEENAVTDGEGSGADADDQEVTDECAMLIHADHMHKHLHLKNVQDRMSVSVSPPREKDTTAAITPIPETDSLNPSLPLALAQSTKSLQATHTPASARTSIAFPLLTTTGLFNHSREAINMIGYGTLREEKTPQIYVSHHQLGSNPSIYSGIINHGSQHSTSSIDQVASPPNYQASKPVNLGEDLYSWMAKQQEFVKDNDKGQLKGNWVFHTEQKIIKDSKINTMTTEDTEDSDVQSAALLYTMKDSLRLLDAHLIFEPLLSSLSVMPQQMLSAISSGNMNNVSSLDSLGSNLSLVSSIETMRIDIVVSEYGKVSSKKKSNKCTSKKVSGSKFHLDIPPETPAFLCEKISIDIDIKKMADMTVDDMIQKQNVLYISRGQLKKHTSTVVNFSLNIRYISQQVNMPLLRLLHQISNMYQNVKETQMELKDQQPETKMNANNLNTNRPKNDSLSTSDLQEQLAANIKKAEKIVIGVKPNINLTKVISPSASIRSRPQSFAQKLRSTGKSVKGYINLSEGIITPNFGASPSSSGLEKFSILSEKCKNISNIAPRCWKTIYYLLDLYAIRPETKMITHRLSFPADTSDHFKGGRKYENLGDIKDIDIEKGGNAESSSTPIPPRELSVVTGERTRLIIFGVAKIHRTRLLATLSGLKLEAEITSLHSSLTCRKKTKPASLECSLTGQIGRTMIVLLEGVAPSQQTIVKVTVGKSQALYSSITKKQKDKNSGLLTVGAVNIDIPQHPVALHGMMTRGSKQLSSTLQELRVTRTSSRMARGQQQEDLEGAPGCSPRQYPQAQIYDHEKSQTVSSLLDPIVMQFNIILQSLSITAALLPSLQAQYKMDQVNSSGMTGSKAKFTIDLPHHSLSFTTKLQVAEANLPSEASIELPKVHVSAEYIQDGGSNLNDSKIAAKVTENAKWILNVQWQMEGVDIHLDVSVGQQLSALGHTLTMLTGSEEDDAYASLDYDSDDIDQPDNRTSQESILIKKSKNWTDRLPAFVFDPSIDAKKRSKLIEKEMNEQAKIINDLRSLGASHGTIEQEMKRLHELEAVVFKDFRRDMIQKLRRQSVKASGIRGKLGLGGKSNSYRSRSFIVPSPTPEHHIESPEDLNLEINSANSGSYESSPKSGPSRSASLKVKGLSGPRVTFSDTHTMCRQSSLPSAGSDLSLPEGSLDWPDTIEIEGEQVQLRKKNKDISSTSSYDSTEGNNPLIDAFGRDHVSTTSSPYIIAQKPQEPNIDFELDVKVLINSGKCVLHTKDSAKEDELKIMSRMKKERSCSGGTFEFQPSSPSSGKKNISSKEKSTISSSRLRYIHHANVPLVDLTIFHIPGLDVKVHYESKTISEEAFSPRISIDNPILNPSLMSVIKKSSTKKASLFAWMTLQSIPEETIISPHILEFLEQTLEPIPSKTNFQSGGQSAMFPLETMESSWAATAASTNYVYASFPVDVIVYFHMQPSTFRFSCLPVSRVECMLQLPSLDIIFSSKRAEEELMEFGECKPTVGQHFTGLSKESGSATGGLSVTGCLADFSVYIFHPYGGGKKSGLKEAQWSPLSDSERKDSLSINVEFVKFHLSRSRKQNFTNEQLMIGSDTSRAVIRFSTIVDIGSASFKYDMRRLTEILAFPKAWYRRSIVRRLFLGDLSSGLAYSEEDASPNNKEEAVIGSSLLKHHDKYIGELLSKSVTERSPTSNREKLRLSFDNDAPKQIRLKDIGRGWSFTSEKQTASEIKLREPAWETLVLFAINFTRLNVHMNMGNVMGNVSWMTKDFRSDGRLSIGSTGHKNLYIGIGLGGSSLDAKGGIVGGIIELSKIDTYIHICEEPDTEPDHTVGLKLFALELRLDYMGTSVLMSRVSSLDVTLRDEWKINRNSNGDAFMPTRRPAIIFMHGDLGWDQLQIMISKSTTADLLKMFYKLDEFFSQQFKSSKRVFSSLQTRQQKINNSSIKKKHMKKRANFEGTWLTNQAALTDARHHRHWQRVLSQVSGLQLGSLRFSLPTNGTVLGGTMELHGSNISLACFHGINFKSKSWALFSLKEPCISFATEAQEIPSVESPNSYDVHVVQTLTISLGQQQEQHARHHSMATVCRLSRSVLFPPQFKSLQEWFHYAFANSEIDAIDRFPCVERERSESTSESSSSIRGRNSSTTSGKLQEHSHTREVIFALPSLQLHLKTEHLQTAKTPDVIGDKPLVECSFITEFEDHIFVTVDAEAFFFLHDLITSYVKEKERVVIHAMQHYSTRAHSPDSNDRKSAGCSTSLTTSSVIIEDDKKRKQYDPAEMFIKDWRSYRCKTWHLEPTVRLLSWAGKSIEPYGIDYILQKLGFSHARTTIPKWIQRGFMDPLDKVLAVIMLRMILAVREEVVNEKAYKKG
ncbi:transmembrane protein KIAA1109 isoform X8 [Nasonia vitripennis]|uniref:Bridge-like lipid transfer protein family member 1 C-terminal domain-containing protein n=1 Tax=Nasonia vitripennis TaxID=7425 RepID=A0A7M7T6Q8_NASVI|nr:transmembrane protein KIAA1109 isoform X8 [Nasonia vitripennis]